MGQPRPLLLIFHCKAFYADHQWILHFRLSDYRESCIVGTHRALTCLLCLAQTSFYCYGGHGVCRHMPLTYYLLNSPKMSQKSSRDIVSSSINLSIVVLVLALQMCIELTRLVSHKREQQSLQTAINAERNLTFARLLLKQTCSHSDAQVTLYLAVFTSFNAYGILSMPHTYQRLVEMVSLNDQSRTSLQIRPHLGTRPLRISPSRCSLRFLSAFPATDANFPTKALGYS